MGAQNFRTRLVSLISRHHKITSTFSSYIRRTILNREKLKRKGKIYKRCRIFAYNILITMLNPECKASNFTQITNFIQQKYKDNRRIMSLLG